MPIGRGVSISTVSQAPSGLSGPGRGVGIPNMINMIPTMGRGMPNIPMNPQNIQMPMGRGMPPPGQIQPNIIPQGGMINNMAMPPMMRPPPQMMNPMMMPPNVRPPMNMTINPQQQQQQPGAPISKNNYFFDFLLIFFIFLIFLLIFLFLY